MIWVFSGSNLCTFYLVNLVNVRAAQRLPAFSRRFRFSSAAGAAAVSQRISIATAMDITASPSIRQRRRRSISEIVYPIRYTECKNRVAFGKCD